MAKARVRAKLQKDGPVNPSIDAQAPSDSSGRWGWLRISALLLWATLAAAPSFALPLTTPLNPSASRTVQGEILKIEGDLYVIKPISPVAGKEIPLRVDEKTVRIDTDSFKVGDVIIADVTPEGHALTITTLPPPNP